MRYLLFDLDGTLTDPKEGILKCFQYALESYGIREENDDALTWVIGPPLVESFMQGYGFDLKKAKEATEKYRERYRPIGWKENKLYPGIREQLERLRNAGYHLGLATSKPEDLARKIMDYFELTECFDFVGGASSDLSRARKEQVIQYVMAQMNITPEDTVLMIGDRKYDVLGAKEFDIPCLGVLYGYGDEKELAKAGAYALCANVEGLSEAVENVFRNF